MILKSGLLAKTTKSTKKTGYLVPSDPVWEQLSSLFFLKKQALNQVENGKCLLHNMARAGFIHIAE